MLRIFRFTCRPCKRTLHVGTRYAKPLCRAVNFFKFVLKYRLYIFFLNIEPAWVPFSNFRFLFRIIEAGVRWHRIAFVIFSTTKHFDTLWFLATYFAHIPQKKNSNVFASASEVCNVFSATHDIHYFTCRMRLRN